MPVKRRQPKTRMHDLPDVLRRYFLDELRWHEALEETKREDYDGDPEDVWKVQWLQWPAGIGVETEEQLWQRHGAEILLEYVRKKPGYRPRAWWRYDAPRCSDEQLKEWRYQEVHPFFSAERWRERPAEPRIRLGGIGTPCYEVLAFAPAFYCGVPFQWVDQLSADYYSGRSRDIHGNPIGTQSREENFRGVPLDPSDPPIFESEAAYLRRHNLFLPGEDRRLTAKHFEPHVLTPDWWGCETVQ